MRPASGPQDDAIGAGAARDLLAVEVLEERDHVLARGAGQLLEPRHVELGAPGPPPAHVLLEPLEVIAMDERDVAHALEPSVREQDAGDAFEETGVGALSARDLLRVDPREPRRARRLQGCGP